MIFIFSMGTNNKSNIIYNRLKGFLEEALGKIEFEKFNIRRPIILFGKRSEIEPIEVYIQTYYGLFILTASKEIQTNSYQHYYKNYLCIIIMGKNLANTFGKAGRSLIFNNS